MIKIIKKLGNGWYSFANIPQDNYIKVDCLRCSTDRKAINQAKRLNKNYLYKIKELKQ